MFQTTHSNKTNNAQHFSQCTRTWAATRQHCSSISIMPSNEYWSVAACQPISTPSLSLPFSLSLYQHHKATSNTTQGHTYRQRDGQTSGTAHQLQQQRKIGNCTKVLTRRRILPTDHRAECSRTGNGSGKRREGGQAGSQPACRRLGHIHQCQRI